MNSTELAALDAVARFAEAEQVEANRTANHAEQLALLAYLEAQFGPSTPVRAAILAGPPLKNPYSTTVDDHLVSLSPGFAIVAVDGELTPSTARLGSVHFTAQDPGASGNGLVIYAVLDTELSTIAPASTPGGASIVLYAVRNTNVDYVIEIVHGGSIADTTYRVSSDAGTSFGSTVPVTSPPLPLPLTPTFIFMADASLGQVFVAGARFSFSLRRQFTITAARGEFLFHYGQFLENMAPLGSDLLLGSVSSGVLEPGSVVFAGGRGGAIDAVALRLSLASQFAGISNSTRERVLQALKEIQR